MAISRYKLLAVIIFIISPLASTPGQKPGGWRGTERSGIYDEHGLLKSWPASGPKMLWEATDNGTGFSSVTVSDDAVYITGRKEGNDVLTSYTQSGKKKWEVVYGKSSESNYPDSRSTPTYARKHIYLVSGMGDMVCINNLGKIVWSVNYFQKYNVSPPRFGISESPLFVDNKIIGTPGGSKAAMVAFNAENGTVVWETLPLNEGTQYVNPLLIEYSGKKVIVTLTAGNIIGVNSADGKILWKFNYEAQNAEQTGRRNHINTPTYRDGYLFAGNGYSQAAVKIKINQDGSEPVLVWKNADINPHLGGAVLMGNYIYSSTHDTNSSGRWICVDWNTGKTMWFSDWYNKGSIIGADGMLYIYEEKSGHIGLVKPGPEKLDVVSEFQITKGSGPYWAHPIINKGRLFVRHGEYMAVFSVK